MEALTDDQAAVYDRQLRVWGVEVQNRLSAAKVLVAGGTGLAAEVCKNLVLAGVGLLAIADDTPCASRLPDGSNFLVMADADPQSSVAEACVCTLQAMNPLVKVLAEQGGPASLSEEQLKRYDLVFAVGLGLGQAQVLDERCRACGTKLLLGAIHGSLSFLFLDLQRHTYCAKAEKGSSAPPPTPQTLAYPSLASALRVPMAKLGRRSHPMVAVLKACARFEQQHGRAPAASDLPALSEVTQALVLEEGSPQHASALRPDVLSAFVQQSGEELAPVAAIVGGMAANHIVRAISGVDPPLKNVLFFGLFDGQGVVEDLDGGEAAGPAA